MTKRSHANIEVDTSPSPSIKKSTGRDYLIELSLQHENYNRELLDRLETEEQRRGKSYQQALAAAKREHDRVRRQAQRAQERNLLELEKAKQQQEDDEARKLDRERQEQIEREIADRRRRAEEAHRLAELHRRAEADKKHHEEEAKRREQLLRVQAQREEDERKAREEAERKARENAAPKNTAPETNGPSNAPAKTASTENNGSLIQTAASVLEAEHGKYLELHTWLKKMRQTVLAQAKQDPESKKMIGDWRREIRKLVGQLTGAKNATVAPRKRLLEILTQAKAFRRITVDVRRCFPLSSPADLNDSIAQISGIFVYELNIFSKALINQWADEASAKLEAADPPGILGTYIFAMNEMKVNEHSLIHILLAKFHKSCPVLFGISGSGTTENGRRRLGWKQVRDDEDSPPKFVTEQRHNERMLGLGAGYASISLRDFSRAPMPNPYPPSNYWRALARIVNTQPQSITSTHLIVLKGLIENSVGRFAKFYRKAAQVALRTALIEFPQKAPDGPAKTGLATLPEVLSKNHGIRL